MAVEEEEDAGDENIVFCHQKSLEEIKKAVASKKEVTKEQLMALRSPEKVPDEDILVPIDLRGVDKHLDDDPVDENLCIDIAAIIEKLGLQAAAEAFVEARRCFLAGIAGNDDPDTPKTMTAKEWREMIEGGTSDEEDGLVDLEGEEEEELEAGDDLEWEEDEEEQPPEPAPKKKARQQEGGTATEPGAKKAKKG
mmetsp:Transcript_17233/g.44333  ORF Transcript_17233/g.44333 Transcript_17233/m.44333 type:complete len:195 (+) Transcript_17233:59-643(+)